MNMKGIVEEIVAFVFIALSFSGNNSAFPIDIKSQSGYTLNIYNIEDTKNTKDIKCINIISNKVKAKVVTRKPSRKEAARSRMTNPVFFKYMWAIKMGESHGNYKSKSKYSSASGAYQYIDSTWNNFWGYKRAAHAPSWLQDYRAYKEMDERWNKYHDWKKVIAAHFYPAYANDKSKWDRHIPGNPTVREYVNAIMRWVKKYESRH